MHPAILRVGNPVQRQRLLGHYKYCRGRAAAGASFAKMVSVLCFGLGAIGGYYSYVFHAAGAEVSVVARSNYQTLKSAGLEIESELLGAHCFTFTNVYNTVPDNVHFDYIVCTVKATNPQNLPAQIGSAVGPNTCIVIIQNGVGNEIPVRLAFPHNPIITCVTWVFAVQPESGKVFNKGKPEMQIGWYDGVGNDTGALAVFEKLLTDGGTLFETLDDMQTKRWEKVVWNAAWNTMTAITLTDTQFIFASSELAQDLSLRLMKEVISVAKALGAKLDDSLAQQLLDKVIAMGKVGSSMMQDAIHGRAMEVDVIIGHPMREAKRLQIDTPTINTIYVLIQAINKRIQDGYTFGK